MKKSTKKFLQQVALILIAGMVEILDSFDNRLNGSGCGKPIPTAPVYSHFTLKEFLMSIWTKDEIKEMLMIAIVKGIIGAVVLVVILKIFGVW